MGSRQAVQSDMIRNDLMRIENGHRAFLARNEWMQLPEYRRRRECAQASSFTISQDSKNRHVIESVTAAAVAPMARPNTLRRPTRTGRFPGTARLQASPRRVQISAGGIRATHVTAAGRCRRRQRRERTEKTERKDRWAGGRRSSEREGLYIS